MLSSRNSEIKQIKTTTFIRIRPYPPGFIKIAARITDPATGASTITSTNLSNYEHIGQPVLCSFRS